MRFPRLCFAAAKSVTTTAAALILTLSIISSINCLRSNEELELNFFHALATLKFDLDDVLAMYKNVTAQVKTAGCQETCRTPLALWVIHNIVPCSKMEKTDCPKGLVCCYQEELYPYETGTTTAEERSSNDKKYTYTDIPENFVQDKIPDDSEENL